MFSSTLIETKTQGTINYANPETGIQKIWMLNLPEKCCKFYRQTTVNGSSLILKFWRGDQVSPKAELNLS